MIKYIYVVFLFNMLMLHPLDYITSSSTQDLYELYIHVPQSIFQDAGNSPNVNTNLL